MISIITPVYNGEKFIENCIKVVIDQNCPDVEHIIMDAGSKDGTVEVIKQYAEKYPHIRWISEKDKGQSDAMNKGIAMAKGEILGFLNVDDYYEPNVLNKVAEIFKNLPEPSFVVANCNVWDNDGNLENLNKPKNMKLADLLLGPRVNQFPVNPTAYFYHTSVHEKIGLYDINEHYAMDIDFIFRVVQVSTIKYIDETWGNHLKIEGTKTFNDSANGLGIRRVYRLIRLYRKNLPLLTRIRVSIEFELLRIIEKINYFSKNPDEIFVKMKQRLT